MRTFFLFIFFLSLFFIFEAFAIEYAPPERFNLSHLEEILDFEKELAKKSFGYKPWIESDFDISGRHDLIYNAGYVFRDLSGKVVGYVLSDSEKSHDGIFRMRIVHEPFDKAANPQAEFLDFSTQMAYAWSNLSPRGNIKTLVVDAPFSRFEWFRVFSDLSLANNVSIWPRAGSGDPAVLTLKTEKPQTLADLIVGSFYSKENKRHVDLMGDGRILVYDKDVNLIREFPADPYNTYREVYFQEKSLIIYYPEMRKKFVYNGRTLEFVFTLDVIDMEAIRARPSCRGYFQ